MSDDVASVGEPADLLITGHSFPRLPAKPSWTEWSHIFTDLDLWRPVVSLICQLTGLTQASKIRSGYPGSCAVFVVDDQVVVKLFPPQLQRDYYKEREVYRLLTSRLYCLPRLMATGILRDKIDWPFLLLEYCEGTPIRQARMYMSDGERLALARTLGQIIRTIHDTTLDNLVNFDAGAAAWRGFLAKRRETTVARFRQETSLSETVLSQIEPFLDSMQLAPPQFQPVLINADLTGDHLLLERRNGRWRISAIIDWADAEIGSAAYEWVALWLGLCNRDLDMFCQLLHQYDPSIVYDLHFRCLLLAHTFLHRFGPGMVSCAMELDGNPCIRSLSELQDWLWPAVSQ